MGDSRNNPRSTQYTGPLPEFDLATDVAAFITPNAAFMERSKLATEEAERAGQPAPPMELTPADRDVVVVLRLHYVVPSRFTSKPPAATFPVQELFRVPFLSLKAQARAVFDTQKMGHLIPMGEEDVPGG